MRKHTYTSFAAAVVLVAGCSSSRSGSTTIAGPVTTAAATTVSPMTTDPSGPGPATTTSGTCPTPPGATIAAQQSTDPLLMSSLIGADIRVGRHPCFERLVIELGGTGTFPGWTVEYATDPVPRGASGDTVYLRGAATLQVRMGMWMQTMEGEGYQGDIQLFPTNVDHLLELRLVENWEGMTVWAVGLDAEYPFTVSVLHAPERLVIDVVVASGS
ncbi:MAG: hypothetical protein Q7V57_12645 [Actinomycetota bacterium]|nr:hypothetical protein [Actinomycetota bacterium]